VTFDLEKSLILRAEIDGILQTCDLLGQFVVVVVVVVGGGGGGM